MRRFREARLWALPFLLGGGFIAADARGQTAPAHQASPPPAPAASAALTPVASEPVPSDLLRATEGGLTSEEVGARAAETSFNAKATQQALRSAAARVDEAWAAFLPRLQGIASYTRLSPLTPPPVFSDNGKAPPPVPPLPAFKGPPSVTNQEESLFRQFYTDAWTPFYNQLTATTFPVLLNNWLIQATLTVPISDYFLRLNQQYSAATRSRDAARFDAIAAKANAAADGKVAFYSWLGSRGTVIVAVQALNDQRSHLALAKNLFDAGQASKSDVLRAGTNVTSAELQVEHAKNLADLAEKQMRVAMHAKDEDNLVPGESLEVNPPPLSGNVRGFIDQALSARMEVKSIEANAAAAEEQAKAAFASRLPVLTGVGDLIYANPNARLFPPTQEWYPTWDVGVRLTWSPNDTFVGGSNVEDLKARAQQLAAQKGSLRDNVEVEVTQDFNNVRESDVSLASAKTELESAEEAYRVTRELFNNGRANSTTLTDSETELTRSRLDLLTARVNARTARVRLDHAVGRDVANPQGAQ